MRAGAPRATFADETAVIDSKIRGCYVYRQPWAAGDVVSLVLRPGHGGDANAVHVHGVQGHTLGAVCREHAALVAAQLRAGRLEELRHELDIGDEVEAAREQDRVTISSVIDRLRLAIFTNGTAVEPSGEPVFQLNTSQRVGQACLLKCVHEVI